MRCRRNRFSRRDLAARLEIHALVHPAHGPVYLPGQFAVEILGKVEIALIAAIASKMRLGAVLGQGNDFWWYPCRKGAIDIDG